MSYDCEYCRCPSKTDIKCSNCNAPIRRNYSRDCRFTSRYDSLRQDMRYMDAQVALQKSDLNAMGMLGYQPLIDPCLDK